jgi:hypothetical protein
MQNLEVTCPVCENDIVITEKEMKLAVQHIAETGGVPLVSCTECCRVLSLPEMPTNGDLLENWVPDVSGETCVPFLDDEFVREPNGVTIHLGAKVYTSGSGVTGLTKRAYMHRYGMNPECAIAKNKNMGRTPYKIQ